MSFHVVCPDGTVSPKNRPDPHTGRGWEYKDVAEIHAKQINDSIFKHKRTPECCGLRGYHSVKQGLLIPCDKEPI